jgi:hypothetical protein
MKLKLFYLTLALSFQILLNAQSKFRFANNNQVGLLSGSSKNALQLQTINGISYKTFSFGIGVGIDNYYFKTIPVFADIRKNIFEKKQTPFVYVDAGSNFPSKKDESTAWQTTTYQPGFYCDFGIGYKWTIRKRVHINSSFGFSQKKYGVNEKYLRFGNDPEVLPPDKYIYRLQRFSMKFGLGF